MVSKDPIRVAITGAGGQIGGYLTHMIAVGNMFGPDQPLILHLIELHTAEAVMKGHRLELEDGAYPLVVEIHSFIDAEAGF